MSEPITLHNAAGKTLNVYTRAQADALLAGGEWFATAADAKAGKVREEPTPATAGKLAALEGATPKGATLEGATLEGATLEGDDGADVEEADAGQPAPAVTEAAPTPTPTKATKRAATKRPGGARS